MTRIANEYARDVKNWQSREYGIEHVGATSDGASWIVNIVYHQDEISPIPGAGQSVQLIIDRVSGKVVRELRFQ